MQNLRTPDDRFKDLDGYPFAPNYLEVPDTEGGVLRMHYVDEGPRDGEIVLCLHGQPTWSYLYRKMVPLFVEAGYRAVAPDFIGFGRSDKPLNRADYTYARHVGWLKAFLEKLDLKHITLVCQDWGGLIGLRAAAETSERFARIVAANTGIPDAKGVADEAVKPVSDRMRAHYADVPVHQSALEMGMAMAADKSGMGFLNWVKFCAETPALRVSDVVSMSCGGLGERLLRGYDAPFPNDDYLAGARQFPSLVPIIPDNVAIPANRAAWQVFERWQKPFLTAFSDNDPVTAGAHVRFQETVPGAKGQQHTTIAGGGHFLQETRPAEFAAAVIGFMGANRLP